MSLYRGALLRISLGVHLRSGGPGPNTWSFQWIAYNCNTAVFQIVPVVTFTPLPLLYHVCTFCTARYPTLQHIYLNPYTHSMNSKNRKWKRNKWDLKKRTKTKQKNTNTKRNDKNIDNNYNSSVHNCYQHKNTPLQYNTHVSNVHCGSVVQISWALPGFPVDMYHLYAFSTDWGC